MKIHLKGNKGTNGQAIYSACASRSTGNGKVNRNNRATYRDIPMTHIVDFKTFAATPDADRCTHCCDRGLEIRNSQRKRNGKPLVKNLFENLTNA